MIVQLVTINITLLSWFVLPKLVIWVHQFVSCSFWVCWSWWSTISYLFWSSQKHVDHETWQRRREVEAITRNFSMSMNFYFKADILHGERLLYVECLSFVAIQYQTCILTVETVWIREIKDINCNFARTKISEWNRMLHC